MAELTNTAPAGIDLDSLRRYDYVPGESGRMIIGQDDNGAYLLRTDVESLLARRAAMGKSALPVEATEKKAKLHLSLRADSGYKADETHRISAEQWGRICAIVNEKE